MKVNWKKIIEIVVYAIISALSALGAGETASAMGLLN